MRANSIALLLVLVSFLAMATLGSAADTSALGHTDPGDHSKPGDHGKPDYQVNPGDQDKPWDHGKPDDHRKNHGMGTVVVTVLKTNGIPDPGARVSIDGQFAGITNGQGMLTIKNVNPGDHQISASEHSRYSILRGSTQIRVHAGQTIRVSIQLRHWR